VFVSQLVVGRKKMSTTSLAILANSDDEVNLLDTAQDALRPKTGPRAWYAVGALLVLVAMAGATGVAVMGRKVAPPVAGMSPAAVQTLAGVTIVKGNGKTNSCPSGYTRIVDEAECRAAMPLLEGGDPDGYNGNEEESDFPTGCYLYKGGVWFNKDEGAKNKKAKPLCKAGFAIEKGGTVFVGDSDVDYWHTSTKEFPGSYNVGIGGATCKDVLKEIDFILDNFKPTQVILVCGENDMDGPGDPGATKIFKRWKDVVTKVNKNGARLLHMGTKPESGTTELHNDYKKYDAKIKEYAEQLAAEKANSPPPVVFVDVFKAFKDGGNPNSWYDQSEKPDYLHMGKPGYAMWDEWAKKAVKNDLCIVWTGDHCADSKPSGSKWILSETSTCPDGYQAITTASKCQGAKAVVSSSGNTWHGVESVNDFPAGCYYCKESSDDCEKGTWFNNHETGRANALAQPYCTLKPIVAEGAECDDGYEKITSLNDCKAATEVEFPTHEWQDEETVDDFPAGCYYCKKDTGDCPQGTWFNHGDGQANDLAQPYCVKSS
jgi:lysophospholipase L1-like esterase